MTPEEVEALEIDLLLEGIHRRYGYDLRGYAMASLRRRLLAVMARTGAPSLGALQHAVLNDAALYAGLIDDLSVRVSEMFRDPAFYAAFRRHVVPLLRTYPSIKVWHSGCASGEEAYASAVLLSEEGLYERAQIYATDVSVTALEHARLGAYAQAQAATFIENYKKSGGTGALTDYFTAAYDGIAMKEALRKNIVFFQHNLITDHGFGEVQVIFCRNVLIYFGRSLRDRVLQMFADNLCPGGFLCLGASESLSLTRVSNRFEEFVPGERIYRYLG